MPLPLIQTNLQTNLEALLRKTLAPSLSEANLKFLFERTRVYHDVPLASGTHVIYWMHHALRMDENPALDLATALASTLGVPLLVYTGLGGNHRYNSDRHHVFILEGVRDVARICHERGIGFACHVPPRTDQPSPLTALMKQAAAVVTEDFPAPPFPNWTKSLASRVNSVPLLCVDTACVVPMQYVGRSFDRAFAFRDKAGKEFQQRCSNPYPPLGHAQQLKPWTGHAALTNCIEVTTENLAQVVARCDIDHSIAPVEHTRGGSVAGYERWNEFKAHGLKRYAGTRNDAAIKGISRLSPYLHYGMVSPFRIAREASQVSGGGADKFLDELFTWREVSHNLCFHLHDKVETLAAIPAWARTTLAEHIQDPREALYSWEQLARGRTHSRIWNAAQRSLLIHGELHNNIRMTWAKALPLWTPTPAAALEMLIDLNHRYALDGNDPNSYGGLLWTLGLFDRPFDPQVKVLGHVRPRPLEAHARRLDLQAYEKQVLAPSMKKPPRVAVIGGGIAGAAAARTLLDHGLEVEVFDKGRGAGGRMSTRQHEGVQFDHGAQYFTVRDERFARVVRSWVHDGHVATWQGRAVIVDEDGSQRPLQGDRYVGVPGMNAVVKHLLSDVSVRFEHQVSTITRHEDEMYTLTLSDGRSVGPFDAVILAVPSPQAATLLRELSPTLADHAAAAIMTPCWAVMAAFASPIEAPFDAMWIKPGLQAQTDHVLAWAARDSSKPGRLRGGRAHDPTNDLDTWVLHASPAWSQAHLELEKDEVSRLILESFSNRLGAPLPPTAFVLSHRWRYALSQHATSRSSHGEPHDGTYAPCLYDSRLQLGVCGDWCIGPRIESAYLSGIAAAGRILTSAHRKGPTKSGLGLNRKDGGLLFE